MSRILSTSEFTNFDTYIACPQAYFHAQYWGNVFVRWVIANKVEFFTEHDQVRADEVTFNKPLTESQEKSKGLKYKGETTKYITDPSNPKRQVPATTYIYRELPHVVSCTDPYTWDVISGAVTPGWRWDWDPKAQDYGSPNLTLLNGIFRGLTSGEFRQMCRRLNLNDDGIEQTYTGYSFNHCLSNFIMQLGV